MSEGVDLYFAYGSNMDPDQMDHRDLGWSRAEGALLRDYRLVFDFDARSRWLGGAADVVPEVGASVEGVLYRLDDDIAVMDGWEGGYRRIRARVVLLTDGSEKDAWTYEVIDKGEPMTPSEVYVDQMLKGAHEFGLSEGFIEELEGHRARGHREVGDHVAVLRLIAQTDHPIDDKGVAGRLDLPISRAGKVLSDLDEWGWFQPGDGGGHIVPEERSMRAPWVLR